MTETPEALLSAEEREALESGSLADDEHRALDAEVGYRVRLLAARPDRVDDAVAGRIAADARLLDEHGHNALVSLVRGRLGDHLEDEDLP